MANIVAIVGRPNVGKSTLYNRLIGERRAIIDDEAGVTRDRQYGTCEWNGKTFTVVDTGGFVRGSDDVFEAAIRDQVAIAIEEAAVIVFVCDVQTGITDLDEAVARMLRKTDKPVVLAVNKVDNHQRLLEANEFWSLGFEETYFLSSMTGSGSGDMLDAVTERLPADGADGDGGLEADIPKIAIVGQPNAGKSSVVNALLGEDRNIVTEVAGTTRDSIHTRFRKFDRDFYLIDTAGLRKKAKVHEDLEFYSVMRAINAIEDADVCILLVDATEGVEAQDMSILRVVQKRNKGLVIGINKWDLVAKETNTMRDFEAAVRARIAPFDDVPIVFTSATERTRLLQLIDAALRVYENRNRRVSTSELNRVMQEAIERTPPPAHRGRQVKIKYVTQLPTYFPAFAFFCNNPKQIKDSYKGYLENQLRERFDFTGVPIGVFFREK